MKLLFLTVLKPKKLYDTKTWRQCGFGEYMYMSNLRWVVEMFRVHCKKKTIWKFSQNSQANTCDGVLLTKIFTENRTPLKVFSFEYCEYFKNSCYIEQVWTEDSGCFSKNLLLNLQIYKQLDKITIQQLHKIANLAPSSN